MKALRISLVFIGLIHLVTGILGLLQPHLLLVVFQQPVQAGLSLPMTNEIRAGYGGMYFAMGAFMLYAAMSLSWMRGALMMALVSCAGAAIGRILSILVDGVPPTVIFLLLAIEIFITIYAAVMLRKTRQIYAAELADAKN